MIEIEQKIKLTLLLLAAVKSRDQHIGVILSEEMNMKEVSNLEEQAYRGTSSLKAPMVKDLPAEGHSKSFR